MTDLLVTACPNDQWDLGRFRALIDLGVVAFRVTADHASPAGRARLIHDARSAAAAAARPVRLYLDAGSGTKPRCMLTGDRSIVAGDTVVLAASPTDDRSVRVAPWPTDLRVGDELHLGDSDVILEVLEVADGQAAARSATTGVVRPNKGVARARRRLDVGGPVNDANQGLLASASADGWDGVIVSFVESAAQVRAARQVLNGGIELIAKVETVAGIDAAGEISAASDVLMVGRADLSISGGYARLLELQVAAMMAARDRDCPVIVASQTSESLLMKAVPSAADAVDVALATVLGASHVMLGPETCANPRAVEVCRTVLASLQQADWVGLRFGSEDRP